MIKEYRIKRGLTQEELAEKLDLSTRQVQRIEREETKTTIKTLIKIRSILKIPDLEMIKILDDTNEQKKDSIPM